MKFDQREWVSDIVTSTLTGVLAGAVGALFVSDPPTTLAVAGGGVAGLVIGLVNLPLRWLVGRLPSAHPEPDERRDDDEN